MSCQHEHHEVETYNKAFIIAIVANGLFVVIQMIYAFIANSSGLLADAVHNLGDVFGLLMAFVASVLMKRKPTEKATFGLKKTSILAALGNGLLLVFSCGVIAYDAIGKLIHPEEVQALSIIIVAGIGIVVNGASALLFMKGSDDLNIKAAYLHLVYDALISVGVVCSGALILLTGWVRIDPIVGLLISVVILKGTWSLFSDSFHLMLDGVPSQISLEEVEQFLRRQQGVEEVHDLHVWALSTKEVALSAHLVMPQMPLSDAGRASLLKELEQQFSIQHVTIQVEQDKNLCPDVCGV